VNYNEDRRTEYIEDRSGVGVVSLLSRVRVKPAEKICFTLELVHVSIVVCCRPICAHYLAIIWQLCFI